MREPEKEGVAAPDAKTLREPVREVERDGEAPKESDGVTEARREAEIDGDAALRDREPETDRDDDGESVPDFDCAPSSDDALALRDGDAATRECVRLAERDAEREIELLADTLEPLCRDADTLRETDGTADTVRDREKDKDVEGDSDLERDHVAEDEAESDADCVRDDVTDGDARVTVTDADADTDAPNDSDGDREGVLELVATPLYDRDDETLAEYDSEADTERDAARERDTEVVAVTDGQASPAMEKVMLYSDVSGKLAIVRLYSSRALMYWPMARVLNVPSLRL